MKEYNNLFKDKIQYKDIGAGYTAMLKPSKDVSFHPMCNSVDYFLIQDVFFIMMNRKGFFHR